MPLTNRPIHSAKLARHISAFITKALVSMLPALHQLTFRNGSSDNCSAVCVPCRRLSRGFPASRYFLPKDQFVKSAIASFKVVWSPSTPVYPNDDHNPFPVNPDPTIF
jgi:hypothetical protein